MKKALQYRNYYKQTISNNKPSNQKIFLLQNLDNPIKKSQVNFQ